MNRAAGGSAAPRAQAPTAPHAAASTAAVAPRSVPAWLLRFGLAFALLNGLLTFENRWPGFGVHASPRLSFELCLAVAGLLGWVAWRGLPSARACTALALAFMALVAVRYADVTAPAVLGRPVNLVWDGPHALELLKLLAASLPPWQWGMTLLAFGVGLLVLTGLVHWAIGTLVHCLAWPRPRPLLLAVVTVLALSFFAYQPGGRDTRWFFALPMTPTLQQQALLFARMLLPGQDQAVLGTGPDFNGKLSGLAGLAGPDGQADVLLLFAESYGAVVFDRPSLASALAVPREGLAQAIAHSGRGVVSARVQAPTFGGASWLAHASLLSGLPITDSGRHDLLLASHRPTLVQHFARHGYRTVGWMPGIKRPWPEGAFYGFERLADDAGIGYSGPDFGYWRIPDQAAIALLHGQELDRDATRGDDGARVPRFVVFPTASTHAPFHPLAPFVADWSRLSGPAAYSAADAAAALAAPLVLSQPLPNYLDSLRYQFSWLADYLRRLAPRPLLVVVVGDHQPPALVTGPGANWDVPVHVISNDPALLQRLLAGGGFVTGLQPPDAPLGAMHQLTQRLLQVFGAAGAAGAAGGSHSTGVEGDAGGGSGGGPGPGPGAVLSDRR